MKYKLLLIAGLLFTQLHYVHADDLFEDNHSRDFKNQKYLTGGETMGGYPIFNGGRSWRIISGKSELNNIGMPMGQLHVVSPMGSDYFAEMMMTFNFSEKNTYYLSEPCKNSFLIKRNKGGGKIDNCMTLNPQTLKILGSDITVLQVQVTNSQQSARLYYLNLALNLDKLGFSGTTIYDWTEASIALNPSKKKLIEKVKDFAEKLQDGVEKAIDYSKPKNAFDQVPALGDLYDVVAVSESTNKTPLPSPPSIVMAPEIQSLPTEVNSNSLEQRLLKLKSLLEKGLISKDQYEAKSTELIKEF